MSDSEADLQPGAGQDGDGGAATANQPPFLILHQFLRDLSFENPSTPHVQLGPDAAPTVDAKVDVTAKSLGEGLFEVELHVEFRATADEHKLYLGEAVYASLVRIISVPEKDVELVLLIEVPRQMFPFTRQIIANATREGGFPSLYLTPFDFVALYNQRLQRRAGPEAGETADA